MRRTLLQAVFLWLEAVVLGTYAITHGITWLVPVAGLLLIPAALLSRGLVLAIPAAVASAFLGFSSPYTLAPISSTVPILALVLGVICAFLAILGEIHRDRAEPHNAILGKFATSLHFLALGIFLAASYLKLPAQIWFAYVSALLTLVLITDTIGKLLIRLYTPRRHWNNLAPLGAFFFFRWLGAEGKACFPSAQKDDELSLKLAEMWMWPVVRRSLPALLGVTVLLSWGSTCLHEVAVGNRGVRHNFGTWQLQTLTPGMHLSLPWPWGGVQQINTETLHETVLGFKADPGQPILWERAHYEEEQKSLVGGGDDFLSISVPVFYRIEDPYAYLHATDQPEKILRSVSERILLHLTLGRPASTLMTSDRERMRETFREELQYEIDQYGYGLHVEEVYLRDIHPPVAVAPAYQEVVGAIEEQEASLHEGEEYQRDVVTRAQGSATQVVVNATSQAENRLAKVRGEASRFNFQFEAWKQSPSLYELREGFLAFDQTLGGAKKAIFDEKLRGSIPMHLDLRKVLNPDLVNGAPPTPQTLIPRPSKSRDAFDLDIEGFLRTDRGEIPAVNLSPENGDNLLNTTNQ